MDSHRKLTLADPALPIGVCLLLSVIVVYLRIGGLVRALAWHTRLASMCRNLATLTTGPHKESPAASRGGIAELARRALRTSRGRGCRWCYLAYERLPAITDPALSVRPLASGTEDIMVAANGETIYSNKQLKNPMEPHRHRTQSDCDFDAHLYEDGGEEVVGIMELPGARMRLALKPNDCERFEVFPPGQMFSSKVEGIAETPTHLGSQPHVRQTECADHHEIIECSFYASRPHEQAGTEISVQAFRSIRPVRNTSRSVPNRVALQSSS